MSVISLHEYVENLEDWRQRKRQTQTARDRQTELEKETRKEMKALRAGTAVCKRTGNEAPRGLELHLSEPQNFP